MKKEKNSKTKSIDINVDDVLENLEGLEDSVDSSRHKNKVRETIDMVESLKHSDFLTSTIYKYTTKDIAQAFVGAIIFSIPLLVEDGVFDIASHFNELTFSGFPMFLVLNSIFVISLTYGILYWSDIRKVYITKPIFGIIPRRLLGMILISFFTTAMMMTLWGRLEGWKDISVAISRINVVWTVAAFGAALGDIIPGESGGRDINEIIKEIG